MIVTLTVTELDEIIERAVERALAKDGNGNHGPGPDRLLTPEEAAKLMSVDVAWLYRHSKQLPFTKRLSKKALRFGERGLMRWLAARK